MRKPLVFPVPPETRPLCRVVLVVHCTSVLLFLSYTWAGDSPAETVPGPNLGGAGSFPKSSKPAASSQEIPMFVFWADWGISEEKHFSQD